MPKEKYNQNLKQHMYKKAIDDILRSPLRRKLSSLSNSPEDPLEQNGKKRVHRKIVTQVPATPDQTPRFVTCVSHDVENGNIKEYTWDNEKIFVNECLQDDVLMLQNVFEGKIISSQVYPLIFDSKGPQKEISLRSIEFYKEAQDNPSLYDNLSPDEKGYFLIGARDLFIAACRGLLSQDEKEILVNIVNLIDPKDSNIVYKTINNIDFSPYPTATHKMVRFIEEEEEGKSAEDNHILDEYFVRNDLGLLIGFVDPRDLSFHNLENIINLDSMFKLGEDFPITNFQKHGDNEVYTFDLEDSNGLLLSLDKCGLYTQPLNKLSRGGERFIFASRRLGSNLTNALKKHASDKSIIDNQFKFVNYVFRYNKFKPGDKKFTSHFDTPYHDPSRRHYSKFTLILYLTPGTADPVLSIDNGKLKIDQIENTGYVKGVIFDQKYEHEGKSFIDTEKIFLRSELVYHYGYGELGSNAEISRKFNIACYMTKQSVFNPELEKYSSDCFNQVAQARLDLAKANLTEDVLLYKTYHGIPFITNGYDYWFLKTTSLKKIAIITLLDYFSGTYLKCNMSKEGYADLCTKYQNVDQTISENLKKEVTDVSEIFKQLKNYASPGDQDEEVKGKKKAKKGKKNKDEDSGNESDLIESLAYGKNVDKKIEEASTKNKPFNRYFEEDCDFCKRGHPSKKQVKDFLKGNKENLKNSVMHYKDQFTIFIFNKEIKIEKSQIKINEDTIVFEETIPSVNFASCQYDVRDSEYLFKQDKINLTGFANIPPIQYKTHDEGYHLKIELFNNGFVRMENMTLKKFYG